MGAQRRLAWLLSVLALFGALNISMVRQVAAVDLEGFADDEPEPVLRADPVRVEAQQPIEVVSQPPPLSPAAASNSGWDEEEFEGFETLEKQQQQQQQQAQAAAPASKTYPRNLAEAVFGIGNEPPRRANYYPEMAGVAFILYYLVNVYLGRKKNEAIALAWAQAFCGDGAVLDRNFALLGPGDTDDNEVLMKESMSIFKFYASGRRYCHGLVATLDLRRRQDLLSMLWYLFNPRADELEVTVFMNEGAMPPMVLAVATKRVAREMQKDAKDVELFARKVEVTRDRIANWPSEKLTVLAEHSSLLYDLMTDNLLDQVFGLPAFDGLSRYFRYLHFTTEDGGGDKKRYLKFLFTLPPQERMADLTKLMTAVTMFIDLVGSYTLTPEQKKRAEARRQERAAKEYREAEEERMETLANKRAAARAAEKDRLKLMSPEKRAKAMERKEKIERKRAQKNGIKIMKSM